MISISEPAITWFEIDKQWGTTQDGVSYFIGRTLSGKFRVFTQEASIESEGEEFTTYSKARACLKNRYSVNCRMNLLKR